MTVLLDKPALTVSTVHVEIKALMVGKKQFTIAMLKQLPEPNILNNCGHYETTIYSGRPIWRMSKTPVFTTMPGNIWGYVRYQLGFNNIHVIIEDDGRLYRVSARDEEPFDQLGVDFYKIDQLFIAV